MCCVLIHGATLQTMQVRLTFLADCLHKGLLAEEIVFLTGTRPLRDDEKKSAKTLIQALPQDKKARYAPLLAKLESAPFH